MNGISTRAVLTFVDYLRSRGFGADEIFNRITASEPGDPQLQRAYIENRRNTLAWDSFASIVNSFEPYFTDEKSRRDVFSYAARPGNATWVPIKLFASLVSSPKSLYRIYEGIIAPVTFGNQLRTSLEVLDKNRLVITLSVPETARASDLFFLLSGMGIASMPSWINLSDSLVDMDVSGHHGRYVITLPPAETLLARFVRRLRALLQPSTAFEDFSQYVAQVRQDNQALRISQTELQNAHQLLETRVAERTRELEVANRQLESRMAELVRKETENLELRERLVHSQKLEAIGTLAGGIAHELNNVLQGIFLALETAAKRPHSDPLLAARIESARTFASRGQDVVKQVLAFSRRAPFDLYPVDLACSVRETMDFLGSSVAKNIEIIEELGELEAGSCIVLADESRIQQVILNLCSNAAYAMQATGGRIRIRLSTRQKGETRSAHLEVADEGTGIPEAIRGRVFDPFFTSKPVGQGSGLGLAVVHGIVQSLGGEIGFDSKEGQGTTFFVTLPLTERLVGVGAERAPRPSLEGKERLLIVDDEAELLALLEEALSSYGYEVATAKSGEEALALVKSHAFDLLITDLVMPRMTGVELGRALRAEGHSLPVILMTGFDDSGLHENQNVAFTQLVPKPVRPEKLAETIRSLITGAPEETYAQRQ